MEEIRNVWRVLGNGIELVWRLYMESQDTRDDPVFTLFSVITIAVEISQAHPAGFSESQLSYLMWICVRLHLTFFVSVIQEMIRCELINLKWIDDVRWLAKVNDIGRQLRIYRGGNKRTLTFIHCSAQIWTWHSHLRDRSFSVSFENVPLWARINLKGTVLEAINSLTQCFVLFFFCNNTERQHNLNKNYTPILRVPQEMSLFASEFIDRERRVNVYRLPWDRSKCEGYWDYKQEA